MVILLFRQLSGQESEREEAELVSSALHMCMLPIGYVDSNWG